MESEEELPAVEELRSGLKGSGSSEKDMELGERPSAEEAAAAYACSWDWRCGDREGRKLLAMLAEEARRPVPVPGDASLRGRR